MQLKKVLIGCAVTDTCIHYSVFTDLYCDFEKFCMTFLVNFLPPNYEYYLELMQSFTLNVRFYKQVTDT